MKPDSSSETTPSTEDDEGEYGEIARQLTPGSIFFTEVPEVPPAVWGQGGEVLWPEGEALMIAAPQGVGKTTLAHQLVRARMGLQETVLGLPVQAGKRVLLLAMDRPAQSRRAGARIFRNDDPVVINDRLTVWQGPPPFDVANYPGVLTMMCESAGADTVVLDSLKDAVIGLSEDTVGAGYNRARQQTLANGIQVVELHHQVKRGANGNEPNTLADVYGSTWITSGAGSVVLLWGEAGDPVVGFRHLKQPMDEIGPFNLIHDHENGTTEAMNSVDLLQLVRSAGPEGLTALTAAEHIFEVKKPTRAQKEKARRRLDRLCDEERLTHVEPTVKGAAAAYFLAAKEAS